MSVFSIENFELKEYTGTDETVVIPDSVTSIAPFAFEGCSFIKSINIPPSVTSIGQAAFKDCSSLKDVRLPEGLAEIETSTFEGCSALESINIPESVVVISDKAFSECTSIKSVFITNIEAWMNIKFIYYTHVLDGLSCPDHTSHPLIYGGTIYLNGNPVTEVVIPDSVYFINARTFFGFKDLVSIIIPETVAKIGPYAFYGCSSLESIYIPDSVKSIYSFAFFGCSSLKTVRMPALKREPEGDSFLEKLDKRIGLGKNITKLEHEVFSGCTSLETINIPEPIEYIGYDAFSGCTSLKSVHITNLDAFNSIKFEKEDSNPLVFGASLYINGEVVPKENISAIATSPSIPEILSTWEMVFQAYSSGYDRDMLIGGPDGDPVEIRFHEDEIVLEEGKLRGFNFHGRFIKLSDENKTMIAHYLPEEFSSQIYLDSNSSHKVFMALRKIPPKPFSKYDSLIF